MKDLPFWLPLWTLQFLALVTCMMISPITLLTGTPSGLAWYVAGLSCDVMLMVLLLVASVLALRSVCPRAVKGLYLAGFLTFSVGTVSALSGGPMTHGAETSLSNLATIVFGLAMMIGSGLIMKRHRITQLAAVSPVIEQQGQPLGTLVWHSRRVENEKRRDDIVAGRWLGRRAP